ncbi:MAG: hypothetical protein KC431_20435 [Myxococcales bacterium]|nr:hypothetical protein [Myxococcales bacterium]
MTAVRLFRPLLRPSTLREVMSAHIRAQAEVDALGRHDPGDPDWLAANCLGEGLSPHPKLTGPGALLNRGAVVMSGSIGADGNAIRQVALHIEPHARERDGVGSGTR